MRIWHSVTLKNLAKGLCRPAGYSKCFSVDPASFCSAWCTSRECGVRGGHCHLFRRTLGLKIWRQVIKQGQCKCSHLIQLPQYNNPGVHWIIRETEDYSRHYEICDQVLLLLLTGPGHWRSHNLSIFIIFRMSINDYPWQICTAVKRTEYQLFWKNIRL